MVGCFALAAVGARADSAGAVDIAPGVYVLRGAPGEIGPDNVGRVANTAFIVGPRGVVVVDSGASFRHGEAIIGAVERVTRAPIRLVVLTHPSQEVIFGAAAFQARGIPVLMHRDAARVMAARCDQCLLNLRDTLGERAMVGSRVVVPDRLVEHGVTIDAIGRPLTLIAPHGGSAPGAIAVLDQATGTLIAGSLVSIGRVPDMRDADGAGWRPALAVLAATRCRHLVPTFGEIGRCADIAAMDGYFVALDERVQALLTGGVGLADVAARADLPAFAGWEGYAMLHAQNAHRAYLRLERESFN